MAVLDLGIWFKALLLRKFSTSLQSNNKVVQIWPGQTVTCLHTNRPGHIWTHLVSLTTLHIYSSLHSRYAAVILHSLHWCDFITRWLRETVNICQQSILQQQQKKPIITCSKAVANKYTFHCQYYDPNLPLNLKTAINILSHNQLQASTIIVFMICWFNCYCFLFQSLTTQICDLFHVNVPSFSIRDNYWMHVAAILAFSHKHIQCIPTPAKPSLCMWHEQSYVYVNWTVYIQHGTNFTLWLT
jgi:hypothetical protein